MLIGCDMIQSVHICASSFYIFRQKGEFQICPRMDLDNILYVEYLRYNNYKNEIILFLERCKATGVHPFCTYI